MFSHLADKTTEDADHSAIVLASDDERPQNLKHRRDDDDASESEDDDDASESEDGDDDDGAGATSNPAPIGTAAPPTNGLFSNESAPRVQVK
jgi:hypothetical protein